VTRELKNVPASIQARLVQRSHDLNVEHQLTLARFGGVTLMAMLGHVRIPLQIDIGAGDAVVPPPDTIDYPGVLDLPRARVRVYRPETSIAEKTEAMVRLALANSRMFHLH
jgi:hypothetical protein